MISRKNILIIVLSLIIGGILTTWLYLRFRIFFLFLFIPIFGVGPLFRNLLGSKRRDLREAEYQDSSQKNDG